jgi:DNA-binding winged helix-turn-helix (wHTH) protein
MEQGTTIYTFGEYELDLPLYELRRAGEPCPLEPQVFDVLSYLVRHHDRLVSKDELLDAIWGHRYVTEANLNARVMAARKALGDTGQDQRMIRTIRGRGYRFIAPVTERPSGGGGSLDCGFNLLPPSSAGKRSWTICGGTWMRHSPEDGRWSS